MKQLLLIILLTSVMIVQAQHIEETQNEFYNEKPFYIGFGLGMDYGGIGGKFEYMFADFTGLFLGVGSNFNGIGINGGVMIKPLHRKQVTPYLLGMYGYTGTVKIEGASQFNMTDYGISTGGGIEIKTMNLNIWQIGIVVPFRSQEFRDHYQFLKDHPEISLDNELFPIQISIGFKILI